MADVYEITSKASIDVDDFSRAVGDGRKSLAFSPENALLLLPLANVEVQLGLLNAASLDARDALEYLDRFAGPAAFSNEVWSELTMKLNASSHFVLGRAAITKALRLQGPARLTLLTESESELALALPDENTKAAYLLGLAKLASGQSKQAASEFLAASRSTSNVRTPAFQSAQDFVWLPPAVCPDS